MENIYPTFSEEKLKSVIDDVLFGLDNTDSLFRIYTGFGGMMTFKYACLFNIYGRNKLPRKLKKKIYKNKKFRLKYIPQYYKK